MAQKLVLFEDVLNGEAIINSKETKAICNHVFGECELSIGEYKKSERLQIWVGDELHKAIGNAYCSVYKVRARFDELKNVGANKEFGGEVRMWLFEPDEAFDDQIVVITCKSNGLFNNENYVVGVIASDNDIENKIKDL